jgi:hypothetical protein
LSILARILVLSEAKCVNIAIQHAEKRKIEIVRNRNLPLTLAKAVDLVVTDPDLVQTGHFTSFKMRSAQSSEVLFWTHETNLSVVACRNLNLVKTRDKFSSQLTFQWCLPAFCQRQALPIITKFV